MRRVGAVPFALGLALFLFAIVWLLNLLGPVAAPVSAEQFDRIREAGLIEYMILYPEGVEWQLRRSIRLLGPGGEQMVRRVVLMDAEAGRIAAWRDAGGMVRIEDGRGQWWGVLFVFFLVGVGAWYLWSQIQLDFKGEGSPRRRLRALEEDLKAGRISDEEFRRRAELIWPEL